jgi:hypothetical protein
MFIYYFVHLNRPLDEVRGTLLGVLDGLDEMAAAAYREGEEIRARISVGESPVIAKAVRLEVGEPIGKDETMFLPIVWEATGTPGLFPRLEAELVLAALGPGLTQLSLRGSYRPPLGQIGRVLDRTLLHRVAEASVKGFVDRLARTIESTGIRVPTVEPELSAISSPSSST